MTAVDLLERPLRLHHLTFVPEDDGVMIGRPDTGSYALFPLAGAELLQRLQAGESLQSCAARHVVETGLALDVDDLLETLAELDFLAGDDGSAGAPVVRWQRLGRWAFSPPAWAVYVAVILAGLVAVVHDPTLRPGYRDLFFTSHLSLIPVLLALGQFPCMLVHEGYHALAGRRLGLPSRLGIGRRFYFLVAETRLNALYSVPRRQRYLPFLAGMLIDTVLIAALTLTCAYGRHVGWPDWVSDLALALAFTGFLRVLWEFLLYLETDVYFVIAAATRCTDLQNAARWRISTRLRRLLRRAPRPSEVEWSERDLAVSRWYAPVVVAGYGLSLASLLLVGLPTSLHFWTTVAHRLTGPRPPSVGVLVDTFLFIAMSAIQLALLGHVTVRDLRGRLRARAAHPTRGL